MIRSIAPDMCMNKEAKNNKGTMQLLLSRDLGC